MADARITTTFRIVGEDAASAQINNVRGNIAKLGPVLSGVGSLAASEFSKLGQGATLVSGVMNLIPGQWGMIGAAAVGAGVLIYNVLNQEKAAADAAYESHKKRLDELRGSVPALAERYGVEIDLLQKKASVEEWTKARIVKNLEMLRDAELQRAASEKAGNEAGVASATAWMAKIHEGNRVLQQRLVLLNQQRALEDAEKQGNADRVQRVVLAEAKVAAAADKTSRAYFQQLAFREKSNEIEVRAIQMAAKRATGAIDAAEAERQQVRIDTDRLRLAAEINRAKEGELKTTRATVVAKRDQLNLEQSVQATLYEFQRKTKELMQDRAGQSAQEEINLLKERANQEVDIEARKNLEMEIAEKERVLASEQAGRELAGNEEALASRRATIGLQLISKLAAAQGKADKEREQQISEELRKQLERGAAYSELAKSGVEALGALGASERALAVIKAGILIGDTAMAMVRSIAMGDYASAAAAAAAGAAGVIGYGAQAFGIGSGSSGSGGGASAPGQYASSASSAGAGGGGNITVVLQGGAVIGTPQAVGQYVQKALGSLSGSGITAAAGV